MHWQESPLTFQKVITKAVEVILAVEENTNLKKMPVYKKARHIPGTDNGTVLLISCIRTAAV
jgi:hypothetical protein